MTEEQLAEIEARANAATEGPWLAWKGSLQAAGHVIGNMSGVPGSPTAYRLNASFVANARTDIPRLIAEVRAGRAKADKLAEALQWMHDYAVGYMDEMGIEKTESALAAYREGKE